MLMLVVDMFEMRLSEEEMGDIGIPSKMGSIRVFV